MARRFVWCVAYVFGLLSCGGEVCEGPQVDHASWKLSLCSGAPEWYFDQRGVSAQHPGVVLIDQNGTLWIPFLSGDPNP